MRIKPLLLLTLVLLSKTSICQSVHGSLIVAAIGLDGIVIAADSREGWIKAANMPVEKTKDSVQKLFEINGILIGSVGFNSFGSKNMSDIVKDYILLKQKNVGVKKKFQSFVAYMTSTYPASAYPFIDNKFISGAYINGKARLFLQGYNRRFIERKSGDSAILTTEFIEDNYFLSIYKSKMSCKDLARVIETSIPEEAKKYHLEYLVGGPISIFFIKKDNSIHNYKNDFSKNPNGQKDWTPRLIY